jgi:hypothetical protein
VHIDSRGHPSEHGRRRGRGQAGHGQRWRRAADA